MNVSLLEALDHCDAVSDPFLLIFDSARKMCIVQGIMQRNIRLMLLCYIHRLYMNTLLRVPEYDTQLTVTMQDLTGNLFINH